MTQTPTAAEEALANATNDASLARSIARSAEIEADIAVNPGRYRMFTGIRPTGNMHLGHYFGTMHSWKTIQDAGMNTWILSTRASTPSPAVVRPSCSSARPISCTATSTAAGLTPTSGSRPSRVARCDCDCSASTGSPT